MKIALVTTLPGLIENKRIKDEAENLGHSLKIVNLKDYDFAIINSNFEVEDLTSTDCDLIIVRGIFSSIKTIVACLINLRKNNVKIFDNNFLTHGFLINKSVDLVKLALNGIKIPNTIHEKDFSDYYKAAAKIGYPLIIKSTRMGKGVGVYKIENETELSEFIEEVEQQGKQAKNYLLQEFIAYKYDLRVLVVGDRVFTMRRIPAKGEFRANFSLGGSVQVFDLDEAGVELAKDALAAVDMSIGGVDILITDDERYILEVNHTAGFVGMEKATNNNIGRLWVEHAIANAR